MLTEAEWLLAWNMFRGGMPFRDIERHFGVGHTTIACGFARKGWYDRSVQGVLPDAPDHKTQHSPSQTTFVASSVKGWTGQQEFVAAFLAKRNKPASFIAEVVNRPVHEVQKFLDAA